ncbi:hypothetical protein [Halostella litorea]|uniref:hypothetical protein n=1 Tax=Halostella litorea TaxID=2528831 RepID=UPI00192A2DFC|nr:hypothetical protein [Halostella litorea]
MVPSPSRRSMLGLLAAAGVGLAGCADALAADDAAHTVSVYLGDRDAGRDVTVAVAADDGTVLFEREYRLSDANEAHEDATFPESTDPVTVVVTVDGERFERPWPAFAGERECSGENWEGVEVWVEGGPDESPSVRITGNCQHVTLD